MPHPHFIHILCKLCGCVMHAVTLSIHCCTLPTHRCMYPFRDIKEQHSEWKRRRWNKIKTKLLKRELEAQYDLVSKLPDEVQFWDVTLSIEEKINELLVCFILCIFLSDKVGNLFSFFLIFSHS